MIDCKKGNYEQRLFSGGLRTWLHEGRFFWLGKTIRELGCPQNSVVELGCYNGRALRYLPRLPQRYLGIDRDQSSLDDALIAWKQYPDYTFKLSETPNELAVGEQFDIGICMETMEHLSDASLDGYARFLAGSIRHYLFVTAPNEKGLVFGAKQAGQRVYGDYYEKYTPREFWHQLTGACHRVVHDQHKGFDYDWLIGILSKYFVVESKTGIPFTRLPPSLGFTVGIVARPKSGDDLKASGIKT